MPGSASPENDWDVAGRLREWIERNPEMPDALFELLVDAVAALEQSADHEGSSEDDMRNGRQLSYKQVLANRGERHRPDGTPIWPLRPDDFPSSHLQGKVPPRRERPATHNGDDLPDWML